MNDKQELGSKTAKGGFRNEVDIVKKFNNWKTDRDSQDWLKIMGYDINAIQNIEAIIVPTILSKKKIEEFKIEEEDYYEFVKFKKADAQIRIFIRVANILKIENLSLKKANESFGYNQLDKRPVATYQSIWNFDDSISLWLKLFTGELNYMQYLEEFEIENFKSKKRVFINEFPLLTQHRIIDFFAQNRILVVSDIIKGRGGLSANWLLVTMRLANGVKRYCLKDINSAMNYYGSGEISVTPRGSLKIGRITMQRKGGTPDPTSLQFKFNPNEVFNF
tara:strand:+ start:93 stop:923 length:831 start_codon:yes stop_codon:yes gene_type:complete